MSVPLSLTILKVTCHQTEDTTGADELFVVAGGQTMSLGEFRKNVTREYDRPLTLTADTSTFQIYEKDLFDPNDLLGTVDVRQDMDTNRTLSINVGSAHYAVEFYVKSQPS